MRAAVVAVSKQQSIVMQQRVEKVKDTNSKKVK